MPSRKHIRHRLLLDEGVHLPQKYPNLNNLHDLTHVYWAKLRGKSDQQVLDYAKKESRMVVVFNTKDFKKLIKQDESSIISLSTNLSDNQADLKICKILKNLKPSQTKGHLLTITSSTMNIKRIESPN